MLMIQQLTFDDLSERLGQYENKYSLSTIEFYHRYSEGQMGDEDDVMMWAGLYHLYLTSLPVRQFMRGEPIAA